MMRYFNRIFFASSCTVILASCASFEMIHDPRFGAVSKEHLPTLIKSVQCELETFYTGNGKLRDELRKRRIALAAAHEKFTPLQTVLDFQHFDLDDDAYGAFSLDIKVQDSLNAPGTTSSFLNVLNPTTGHTKSLALGPSVQAQGTYDNVLWFAVRQSASVEIKDKDRRSLDRDGSPSADRYLCFRPLNHDPADFGFFLDLEAGKHSELQLFDRIRVDGGQPLAAWLQENSVTMGVSRNLLTDAHSMSEKKPRDPLPVAGPFVDQAIDGGQLSYVFTVQYTGALDVKFSLVSSRWNPATADISGGIQQTNVLSIYLNGYQAATALGAKSNLTATVAAAPKPIPVYTVADPSNPARVAAKDVIKKLVEKEASEDSKQVKPTGVTPLSEFISELSKSQLLPGQKDKTLSKIESLGLSQGTKDAVRRAVEDLGAQPPARAPTNTPAPIEQNNGRGVFRYPPAFPSPQ